MSNFDGSIRTATEIKRRRLVYKPSPEVVEFIMKQQEMAILPLIKKTLKLLKSKKVS